MRKIAVFIDMQNIFHTTRDLYGDGRINWLAVQEYLISEARDARVTFTAFVAYDPENQRQVNFLNWLALNGFRVVSECVKRLPDGTLKANMDVRLALEVIVQAPNLDEVVLVTGDGDFAPVLEHLCRMGRFVHVLGPQDFTSPELIKACHRFTCLHEIPNVLDIAGLLPGTSR